MPEDQLRDAQLVRSGKDWTVTFEVKNAGTSRMPVELAAVRGERFDDKGKPRPGYRDVRTRIILGPGEARQVEIVCAFEPERVVADPDVQVLQLRRKRAVVEL